MKIHFTAIGGTGMGAAAGLMRAAGHEVRGSDGPLYPPMRDILAELAIPVARGFRPDNLDWGPDLVVLGNTCRADNPEHVAARERRIRVVSFPELLAERILATRQVIVVAGTHGKTTTTALVAHLLSAAGRDPGLLVGGIPLTAGRGFALGSPPFFVIEGDEYDAACFDKRPKLAHYRARAAILTGIEFDHADIYPDMEAVRRAFHHLPAALGRDGRLVVWAGSDEALALARQARGPVERYGLDDTPADWRGRAEPLPGGRQRLRVRGPRGIDELYELPLSGTHNAANALAAIALCRGLGVPARTVARGLASFRGVRRRQEVRGRAAGVTVIDDFAHHPTAVACTLRGLRGVHGGGRLIAVFEPRSATSRRRVFQQAWPEALAEADCVFLAPLFAPERVPEGERLDVARVARDLAARGREANACPDIDAIVAGVAGVARPGDTVVVMSSGGFGGVHERLLAALAERGG